MTGAPGGAAPADTSFPELFDPTCDRARPGDPVAVELALPDGAERAFCLRRAGGRPLPAGRVRLGPGASEWFAELAALARASGLDALAGALTGALERSRRSSFVVSGRSRSLALGRETRVMGVVNRTPDSFSDGGRYLESGAAVAHGLAMAEAGAAVIDVGGESTRPGSMPVPPQVQVDRVCPVLAGIRARSDVILSVDTTRAEVAAAALRAGADWVNDTSALTEDPDLLPLIVRECVPVVLMHRPAPPRTMQDEPRYQDAPAEVRAWLRERIASALRGGVAEHRIVVDPGIGFGKRLADNLDCLVQLGSLASLGLPILVGTSRKSFLGGLLGVPTSGRIWGTAATVALAAWLGAHLVRVHDVSEMVEVIKVVDAMRARAGQT